MMKWPFFARDKQEKGIPGAYRKINRELPPLEPIWLEIENQMLLQTEGRLAGVEELKLEAIHQKR